MTLISNCTTFQHVLKMKEIQKKRPSKWRRIHCQTSIISQTVSKIKISKSHKLTILHTINKNNVINNMWTKLRFTGWVSQTRSKNNSVFTVKVNALQRSLHDKKIILLISCLSLSWTHWKTIDFKVTNP